MKYIVRAFVVVLALTGAAASTQIASASAKTTDGRKDQRDPNSHVPAQRSQCLRN